MVAVSTSDMNHDARNFLQIPCKILTASGRCGWNKYIFCTQHSRSRHPNMLSGGSIVIHAWIPNLKCCLAVASHSSRYGRR